MLHLAAMSPPEPKQLRRAMSSSAASTHSDSSTVTMPSLTVRRRLQSNGSSGLLNRAAGLDLRLERQLEVGQNKHSAEMQRIVELVMENKLERVPDKVLKAESGDAGSWTQTNDID